MRYLSAGNTDRGYVRSNNEDGFLIDVDHGLYAVADGMGGHQAGEIASSVTLEALKDTLERNESLAPESTLSRALQTAGLRLLSRTEKEPSLGGMGTTLTAMLVEDSKAHIVHVGDSRCYRLRSDRFELLTEDHSWVWEQRKAGLISDADLFTHPMRNVITRSVGHGGESNPDIFEVAIEPGDTYVLCTDGLCGFINDEEISAIVRRDPSDVETIVAELIRIALEAGGEDNVTVVALRAE